MYLSMREQALGIVMRECALRTSRTTKAPAHRARGLIAQFRVCPVWIPIELPSPFTLSVRVEPDVAGGRVIDPTA